MRGQERYRCERRDGTSMVGGRQWDVLRDRNPNASNPLPQRPPWRADGADEGQKGPVRPFASKEIRALGVHQLYAAAGSPPAVLLARRLSRLHLRPRAVATTLAKPLARRPVNAFADASALSANVAAVSTCTCQALCSILVDRSLF